MTEFCTTFSNTPRTKGKPFKKRVGDDMLERSASGEVCRSFGYYAPEAALMRKVYAGRIRTELRKTVIGRMLNENRS